MKAILVLMDTLRYDLFDLCADYPDLLPNFQKLAAHSVRYTKHYAGSLPCMPARRELHTGRYNFLHRGWGPLEPFDDSMPELLKQNGVYTHLVSDHYHYWDDGGATYHGRYNSWENIRGHEADPWKPYMGKVDMPDLQHVWRADSIRQNYINRKYMPDYESSSLVRTFDLGLEFIDTNFQHDNWFLQIESFTPHEPFVAYPEFRSKLPGRHSNKDTEWGVLARDADTVSEEDTRNDYRALLAECDHELGRLLDRLDQYGLWDDTMIILTADHGTLMGEHGEWNKNRQPLFEEVVRTPFFVWDPRDTRRGITDDSLNRMIDVPATLLELFQIPLPENMMGRPIRSNSCKGALFGYYGSYVCCTDGQYVYMRAAKNAENLPLNMYFMMPTELFSRFPTETLKDAILTEGKQWTKHVPVLKVKAPQKMFPQFMYKYGTLLYDVENDPKQMQTMSDAEIEANMESLLIHLMHEAEAPAEQYQRLGLSNIE